MTTRLDWIDQALADALRATRPELCAVVQTLHKRGEPRESLLAIAIDVASRVDGQTLAIGCVEALLNVLDGQGTEA